MIIRIILRIKEFLQNREDEFMKQILAPRTSPRSVWSYFKFIKIAHGLLFSTFIPVGVIPTLVFSWFKPDRFSGFTSFPGIIFIAINMALFVYFGFEIEGFKCPRCQKKFFGGRVIRADISIGYCNHCGLAKWAEIDDTDPAPAPADTRKQGRVFDLERFLRLGVRMAAALWLTLLLVLIINEFI